VTTINVSSLPVANAGSDATICIGSSTTLHATGGNSYSWSPSNGLSCSNCPDPQSAITISTTYIVTATDLNSCTSTSSVTVIINSLPVVNLNSDTSLCEGDLLQLNASGATSYTWNPTLDLSCINCPDPLVTATSSATYQVTGTDDNNCSSVKSIHINVNSLPQTHAGTDITICEGYSPTLQATGGITYNWSPSAGLDCTQCSNPVFTGTTSAAYTLSSTDTNGCKNTDDLFITVEVCNEINEADNHKWISVYPNPSNDFITIASTKEIISVQIFSMNGKLIYQSGVNRNLVTLNTADFSPEAYLMRLITADEVITEKFIVN
jgi:hypothetical protein